MEQGNKNAKESYQLKQLGQKTALPNSPNEAELEPIEISNDEMKKAVIQLDCPEFTSLCPVTGQPDFAKIFIDFIPNQFLVESKSLKLFLGSFRNHGAFHEECTVMIGVRIKEAIKPRWIRVYGVWFPRGGISINTIYQDGNTGDIYVPPLKHSRFNGR